MAHPTLRQFVAYAKIASKQVIKDDALVRGCRGKRHDKCAGRVRMMFEAPKVSIHARGFVDGFEDGRAPERDFERFHISCVDGECRVHVEDFQRDEPSIGRNGYVIDDVGHGHQWGVHWIGFGDERFMHASRA